MAQPWVSGFGGMAAAPCTAAAAAASRVTRVAAARYTSLGNQSSRPSKHRHGSFAPGGSRRHPVNSKHRLRASLSSVDEDGAEEGEPGDGILEIIQTLDLELEEGVEPTDEMNDEMWLVIMQRKGRALAEELQRRKVEAAVRAQAQAKLHAERVAEQREMATTLQQLAETKRQVEKLALEVSRVDELHEALEEQTRALEEVSESMQEGEATRAAEVAKAVQRFKELEAALQEAENEVSQIPADLEKMQKLEQKLQKNIETMDTAVKRAEELEGEMEVAKQAAKDAEESVKEVEATVAAVQKKLDAALKSKEGTVTEASAEQERIEKECHELRALCEAALKQKVEMSEELKAAKVKGQEAARKLEKVTARLETKEVELQRLEEMSKQVETTLAKVEAYSAGGTEDLLSALPTGQEIPPILERLRSQLQKASVRESTVKAETESIQKVNAELDAERTKLEESLKELSKERAACLEQMDTDVARVSMIERENNKQVESSDEVDARREILEKELAEATAALEEASAAAVDKNPSCEELESELREATEACKKLGAELEKLPSSTLVTQKEAEALKGQERRATEALKETRELLEATEKKVAAKEEELSTYRTQLDAVRSETGAKVRSAESMEEQLRRQLEEVRAESRVLRDSEREASASCEAMAIQLESSLSSTRAALQWRLQVTKKMDQIEAGQASDNTKARSGAIEKELQDLQDAHDLNGTELLELTSALSEANSSIAAKEQQIAMLVKQLEDVRSNEEQRKSELENVGLKMTELVEELEKLKNLVAQKEAAVEKWQQEAQAAREITSHAAELGEETSALASEISRIEEELQEKEANLIDTLEERKDLEIEMQALREATADLETGVAQIRAREAAMKAAMQDARADQDARLESIRLQAEEEAHKAMALLTKAEGAAHSLGHKMSLIASEAQTAESEERARMQELEAQNVNLRLELDDKIDDHRDITEKFKVLEKDVAAARVREARQVAGRRKDLSAQTRAEEFRVNMIVSRLARVDAEAEKYRSQAAALEGRNAAVERKLRLVSAGDADAAGGGEGGEELSEQLESASDEDRAFALFARLRRLETENVELKEASDKRDKVLLRSKRFIEALNGKKNGKKAAAPAAPAATPATAAPTAAAAAPTAAAPVAAAAAEEEAKEPETTLTNLRSAEAPFKASSKEMGQTPAPKAKTARSSRAAAKMRVAAQKEQELQEQRQQKKQQQKQQQQQQQQSKGSSSEQQKLTTTTTNLNAAEQQQRAPPPPKTSPTDPGASDQNKEEAAQGAASTKPWNFF